MRVRTKRCGALNPLSRRLGGLKAGAWVGGTVPMVNQEHESLLDDTKRVEGHSALRDNVAAANALADAVRSTLGPRGLDKLLVGEDGENLVTNDGVTVLETAQVEHPTAKMLISAASAQDRQALDGTTTTVLLTAELLQNGLELVERGVHPAVICAGWNMAQERAAADLLELARAPSGDDDMLQAVRTALAGKIDEGVRETLSHLAVHAARAIASEEGGEVRADPSLVKVINDVGGGGGGHTPRPRTRPTKGANPSGYAAAARSRSHHPLRWISRTPWTRHPSQPKGHPDRYVGGIARE